MKKHTDSPAAAFPETITFRSTCARPKSGVSLLNLFLTLLGYGGILWAMMTLYTPDCRKAYFLPAAGVLFLIAAGIQLLPRFSGKLTLGYLGPGVCLLESPAHRGGNPVYCQSGLSEGAQYGCCVFYHPHQKRSLRFCSADVHLHCRSACSFPCILHHAKAPFCTDCQCDIPAH